jgi:cytochrome P450
MTVTDLDVPVHDLPLFPLTRHTPKLFGEFFALALGMTDDTGFKMRKHGEAFRLLPALPRPLSFPIELYIDHWAGESILITSPRLMQEVYALPPEAIDEAASKKWSRFVFGAQAPFVLAGRDHQTARQALAPELTPAAVERYRELSNDVLDSMIDRLAIGRPIKLHQFYAAFAQEVILRFAFGIDDQAQLDRLRRTLNRAIEHCTGTGRRRALLGFMAGAASRGFKAGSDELPRYLAAGRKIRRETDALIQHKIDELRSRPNDSFASRLIARAETDPFWTDKVLRDMLATILIAGHDTSVTAYDWATEFLLHDDDARKTLVAEAKLAATDTYAQAVNVEALRLKAPVWGTQVFTKQDIALDGHRVRKNTWIFGVTTAVHYDEELYPEPGRFLPERFFGTTPDRHGFLAFGAGRHRCPGSNFFFAEAGIVLHRMFGRLEMRPMLDHVDDTVMTFGFFNRPKNGTEVVVLRRRESREVPAFTPAEQTSAGVCPRATSLDNPDKELLA